jgi:phage/plasmid-associated DNA primase
MSKSNLIEVPETNDDGDLIIPKTAVVNNALAVGAAYRVVRFRNRPMILDEVSFPHFRPLHKEQFDRIAYPLLGGKTRGQMNDTFAYLANTAEDLSHNEHLILFGVSLQKTVIEADTDLVALHANKPKVWNMQTLAYEYGSDTESCIWRSPFSPIKGTAPLEFIMQLAGGDEGVYDDIMQSIAPLIMDQKPDGVIWWVGDGANGKSTLMDALYKLFPNQLASLTVKRLTDGRDTPSLNGTLGNIVKESSEGRIDDTEIYKSIGTHEDFRVHKFHSQDDIQIRGNLHHIFNANLIPAFNDKGFSARRRTYVIPFNERFASDPTFEARTFTPEFFGRLVAEMCKYAQKIAKQGYRYKWSAATLGAKAAYDTEANNAEEYAHHIVEQGIVAFDSFQPMKMDYENWCADNGYVPLGVGNMRRALQAAGYERVSFRDDKRVATHYRLPIVSPGDLQAFGMGRPGMYTTHGFQPAEPVEDVKDVQQELVPDNIVKGW